MRLINEILQYMHFKATNEYGHPQGKKSEIDPYFMQIFMHFKATLDHLSLGGGGEGSGGAAPPGPFKNSCTSV